MNARVTTLQLQSGKIEEAVSLFNGSIVPALKQQAGFQSAWLLTEPQQSKVISITMWATEADRLASEANGFLRTQLGKLGQIVASAPVAERYRVSAQA